MRPGNVESIYHWQTKRRAATFRWHLLLWNKSTWISKSVLEEKEFIDEAVCHWTEKGSNKLHWMKNKSFIQSDGKDKTLAQASQCSHVIDISYVLRSWPLFLLFGISVQIPLPRASASTQKDKALSSLNETTSFKQDCLKYTMNICFV